MGFPPNFIPLAAPPAPMPFGAWPPCAKTTHCAAGFMPPNPFMSMPMSNPFLPMQMGQAPPSPFQQPMRAPVSAAAALCNTTAAPAPVFASPSAGSQQGLSPLAELQQYRAQLDALIAKLGLRK